MTILNEVRTEITDRLEALPVGAEFSLQSLFGGKEAFDKVALSGRRKALGKQFRKAVEDNQFHNVEYSHLAESPIRHIYRRT